MIRLLIASLLTLAPAEAARAAGPDAPTLEIVTFRLIDAADDAAFISAAAATQSDLAATGQVVRRYLTKDDTGLWTDIIEWRSRTAAERAAQEMMTLPSFAAFVGMIDPASVELRHAAIESHME